MQPFSLKKYGLHLLSLLIFLFVVIDVFSFILVKPKKTVLPTEETPTKTEVSQLNIGSAFNPMTEGAIGLTVTVTGMAPTSYLLADGTSQPALLLSYSIENWAPVAIALQPFTVSDGTGFTTQSPVPIEGVTSPDLLAIEAGQKLDFAKIYPIVDYASAQIQYDQAVWRFLENAAVPTLDQTEADVKKNEEN